MSVLTIERAEGHAVLTLNRPEVRNALSRDLRADLAAAVRELDADPKVQVLVLTGAGPAFCAGLDLQEIGSSDQLLREALTSRSPVDALQAFRGPVIGAINGPAITGGFELALGCDILLAAEGARFADTHGRVGLLPIWGLSQRLSRLVGPSRAKELSLTGNFLDAHTACAWGLVNRVHSSAALLPAARKLARDMESLAPGMLAAYKRQIDEGFAVDFGRALRLEQKHARVANRSVTCEVIEARRSEVVARGRSQRSG